MNYSSYPRPHHYAVKALVAGAAASLVGLLGACTEAAPDVPASTEHSRSENIRTLVGTLGEAAIADCHSDGTKWTPDEDTDQMSTALVLRSFDEADNVGGVTYWQSATDGSGSKCGPKDAGVQAVSGVQMFHSAIEQGGALYNVWLGANDTDSWSVIAVCDDGPNPKVVELGNSSEATIISDEAFQKFADQAVMIQANLLGGVYAPPEVATVCVP